VVAEKLIVENVYEDDDIPVGDCQIYTISSPSDDTPICSVESEGLAHAFAAAPLMLEALEALTAVIRRSVLTPILTDKAAVQQAVDQANAAIAAAKGE
jgi:hypothetical protein